MKIRLCFVLILVGLFVSNGLNATTKTISGGSWLVSGNWSPTGLPGNGDTIIITGAVNLPFQDNDISLNGVRIILKTGAYFTLNKKCDLTLDGNSALIIESGATIEGTHGNSVAIIGSSGNLVGNGSFSGPRAANEGGWNAGSTSPLPVALVSFLSETFENRVELEWKTASELNNDYFIVERKLQSEWEAIGQVTGNGTTNEVHFYQYSDYTADLSVSAYYRLRQIDYDGNEDVSHVIQSEVIVNQGHLYVFKQNGSFVELNFEEEHLEQTTIQLFSERISYSFKFPRPT